MIRNFISLVLAVLALNAWAAVDVNQATRADLESVKGIGPGLSGKIIEARKASAFRDWPDLVERVGGIGPGNAARLSQAGLTVGGASFDGRAAAPAAPKASKEPRSRKAEKAEKAEKAAKSAA